MSYSINIGDKHALVEFNSSDIKLGAIAAIRKELHVQHPNENVILNLPKITILTAQNITDIKEWFHATKAANHSFIIVSLADDLGVDLPNIEQTPTISEARDMIFMEEVERELGASFDFDE